MAETVMGVETEYMLSAFYQDGARVDQSDAMGMLYHAAERTLRYLPGAGPGGMFVENGSRFYIDCGGHPEIASPEVTSPWDVVRWQLAADRILVGLAEELRRENPTVAAAHVYRNNIGYDVGVSQATWGCHGSYRYTSNPDRLPNELVSHLASRLIYTGGGGFSNLSLGANFTLSPRVAHLCHVVSYHSTNARGIFHTKDEPLARSGHRLHLYCGESLHSEEAAVLRHGTTALVLAMVDAGLRPGEGMRLRAPLEAMRDFANDPTCRRATAETETGRSVRALDIQRHYLHLAEMAIGEPFMPEWAEALCGRWRAVLDLLEEGGAAAAATKLDWAIKYAIYTEMARRQGLTWDQIAVWSNVVQQVGAVLQRRKPETPISITLQDALTGDSPAAPRVRRLTPVLRRHDLTWDDLDAFLDLRLRLFEADTCFGRLGEGGIFAEMDRAGLLEHHAPGVDRVDEAMTTPPATTRAALRGKWIKELAGNRGSNADWSGIFNARTGEWLDLSDPLTTREEWKSDDERLRVMAAAQFGMPPSFESLIRREGRRPAPGEQPGRFSVGDPIILGRHESVDGNQNWNADMDQFVGQRATILRVVGLDSAGCEVVRVTADQSRYVWRTRNMERAPDCVA
ncbi:MAG TPA: proteasome accessory factor PafA2 family protein [Candidatus Hydrogenedentes bacterium]|nr:proteasome accessory factor PafA2 family protein [Candidatus Hydrogenedentota bacterium]